MSFSLFSSKERAKSPEKEEEKTVEPEAELMLYIKNQAQLKDSSASHTICHVASTKQIRLVKVRLGYVSESQINSWSISSRACEWHCL